FMDHQLRERIIGVPNNADVNGRWCELGEKLKAFSSDIRDHIAHASDVAARVCEALYNAGPNWVPCGRHDDWNRGGCLLERKNRRRTRGHDDFDIQTNEIVREFGQAFVVTSGPAVFNEKVLAFLVAKFPQRFLKGVHPRSRRLFRPEKADPPLALGLLPTRRERPRSRAAEQGDEIA